MQWGKSEFLDTYVSLLFANQVSCISQMLQPKSTVLLPDSQLNVGDKYSNNKSCITWFNFLEKEMYSDKRGGGINVGVVCLFASCYLNFIALMPHMSKGYVSMWMIQVNQIQKWKRKLLTIKQDCSFMPFRIYQLTLRLDTIMMLQICGGDQEILSLLYHIIWRYAYLTSLD